jgi:hypothetical protein
VPASERQQELARARAHWLLALGTLEEPQRRPCLVLVAGLPGSGKSTLARALAAQAGFTLLRSDVIRKELAGVAPLARVSNGFEQGIYAPPWTERTYGECLRRAEDLLWQGERVVIDASFRDQGKRELLLAAARRWGVPGLLLHCQARPEIVEQRLRERQHDVSDADAAVFREAVRQWHALPAATPNWHFAICADNAPAQVLHDALRMLHEQGLHGCA